MLLAFQAVFTHFFVPRALPWAIGLLAFQAVFTHFLVPRALPRAIGLLAFQAVAAHCFLVSNPSDFTFYILYSSFVRL